MQNLIKHLGGEFELFHAEELIGQRFADANLLRGHRRQFGDHFHRQLAFAQAGMAANQADEHFQQSHFAMARILFDLLALLHKEGHCVERHIKIEDQGTRATGAFGSSGLMLESIRSNTPKALAKSLS